MTKAKAATKKTGAAHRRAQRTPGEPSAPSRGSSIQGELQRAKGGPAGANQGGSNRGSSRAEPSHLRGQQKKDKPKR